MNKEEQIKFIEDNYPLFKNHISKRLIRHDFFREIKTELQAYLLGFYAADGNINEKRKTLRIHLHEQDSDIVNLFKDVISPDARTFVVLPKTTTGRNHMKVHANKSYGVDITSAKICNDLVALNFGYKKTYKEHDFPEMEETLLRHFVRGYFDGDGSVSATYQKPVNNRNERMRMSFTIDFKMPKLAISIQKLFAANNIKSNIIYLKRDDMYRLSTSSIPNIKKIFNFLYKDSYFYGNRKYKKFNHIVNTEVTQLIAEYRNA